MLECGGQRTISTYSLEPSTLYFETGSLIGLELLEQAGWSVIPGELPVSACPVLGLHM